MKNIMIFTLISTTLVGCNPFDKHIKCDDPKGLELVKQQVQESLVYLLDTELKELISSQTINDLDPAKLKLSLNNIKFDYKDSRTDHIDPDSPKTKCSIDLTVTIPQEIIKNSDDAREHFNTSNVEQQARNLDLIYSQGKIEIPVNYILQPTDKGDKVIAYVQGTTDMKTVVKETLLYAFLKPQIEKNKINSRNVTSSPTNRFNNENTDEIVTSEMVAASEVYSDY